MNDDDECTCGDVRDEHGGDDEYPNSTACQVCASCDAFEIADDDPRDLVGPTA